MYYLLQKNYETQMQKMKAEMERERELLMRSKDERMRQIEKEERVSLKELFILRNILKYFVGNLAPFFADFG